MSVDSLYLDIVFFVVVSIYCSFAIFLTASVFLSRECIINKLPISEVGGKVCVHVTLSKLHFVELH